MAKDKHEKHDKHDTPVIVSESGQGPYQQNIRVGKHHLIADEPVAMGGADTGQRKFNIPKEKLLAIMQRDIDTLKSLLREGGML